MNSPSDPDGSTPRSRDAAPPRRDLTIQQQPDDTTCGPTCLQAVYAHHGDVVDLHQLIDEVHTLESGGTLATLRGLPALSASSPLADGRPSGALDTRLLHYAQNFSRVPAVTGLVVPEDVESFADYDRKVLAPIARALEPLDPDRVLQPEWTNARGAIPRFGRGSLEIRVLDVQECPRADLAILDLAVAALHALVDWGPLPPVPLAPLAVLHRDMVARGLQAVVDSPEVLAALGRRRNARSRWWMSGARSGRACCCPWRRSPFR